MSGLAYLDASCLAAIALQEPSVPQLRRRLMTFDEIVAHPLVEAEVMSACAREAVPVPDLELQSVTWLPSAGSVRPFVMRVLRAGYLRGADAFHLAVALGLDADPGKLTFLTLDTKQRAVAKALGFRT